MRAKTAFTPFHDGDSVSPGNGRMLAELFADYFNVDTLTSKDCT